MTPRPLWHPTRHRAPVLAWLLLAIALFQACGGESVAPVPPPAPPPAPPPPPPPPPPPTGRIASPAAGNQQTALVGAAVAVAPAVRVVNSAGAGVAGVSVTFAVGTGGGTVTSASQTTAADGVATVGSWVLGSAGTNTLLATVAEATAGSPVTFTATGQDLVVAPSQDSTISGTVQSTQFTVPAGVTVTLGSDVIIRSTVRVTVNGTIRGDCRRLEVDASGELLVTGTIDNSCAAAGAAGQDLSLLARGGYGLTGGTLRSSGAISVSNVPTAPGGVPASGPDLSDGSAALLAPPCTLSNVDILHSPARAPNGTDGTATAGPGSPGASTMLRCAGLMQVNGGVNLVAQSGGHGGSAHHTSASSAQAQGGAGGNGGQVTLEVVGDLQFTGVNRIESGEGGAGGVGFGEGLSDGGATPKAGNGKGIGGSGGVGGQMVITATGNLSFAGATELALGRGGHGADGIGDGGPGASAGANNAQHAGDGEGVGGAGGARPDLQFAAGTAISGQTSVTFTGGEGGRGGDGIADGAVGGHGDGTRPAPGAGGRMTATGGVGGESRLRRFGGPLVASGGNGGSAEMQNGRGGNAGTTCVAPPGLLPGLAGGGAGDMSGSHGAGGAGAMTGTPGENRLVSAGIGGRGGNGWPDGGVGGPAGMQTMSKPPVITGPAPFQGQAGFKCLGVLGGSTATGYVPPPPGLPPCRTQSNNVEFVSFVNIPVTFTVTFDPAGSAGAQNYTFSNTPFNPNGSGPGVSGATPPYDELVHQFMGARGTVYSYWDYCSTTGPFTNAFTVTAMVGGSGPFMVGTITYVVNP